MMPAPFAVASTCRSSLHSSSAWSINARNVSRHRIPSSPAASAAPAPPTCTQIVTGHFTGSDRTDLLLYNGVDSQLEIWTTGADGKLTLLNSHPTQETWRRILPIQLETATPTSLLFYSSTARLGRFVNVDGDGNFSVIKDHTDWRRDWTTILSGSFGGSDRGDLLFYSATAGSLECYKVDANGSIDYIGGRQDWHGDNGLTSLLFYDPAGAEGGEVP